MRWREEGAGSGICARARERRLGWRAYRVVVCAHRVREGASMAVLDEVNNESKFFRT